MPLAMQFIAKVGHERKQRFRLHRIEQVANLVVTRNLVYPKE